MITMNTVSAPHTRPCAAASTETVPRSRLVTMVRNPADTSARKPPSWSSSSSSSTPARPAGEAGTRMPATSSIE